MGPGALRMARRGFALAVELRLPLITIVDTAGAELSVAAEQGGLAGEIARCLSELTTLPVPTVSVLLGMGCGGGALALLPADRVVAAAHAWVSPLPLEGASVIRYRTPDRAADMARSQRLPHGNLPNQASLMLSFLNTRTRRKSRRSSVEGSRTRCRRHWQISSAVTK